MTSEVVILNRKGLVLAADSAVTVVGVKSADNPKHPRYSKAANKVFDISPHGCVAATIFESAEIDGVPWELALKQFRASLSGHQLGSCFDYVAALRTFLQANAALFPPAYLSGRCRSQKIMAAGIQVVLLANALHPALLDANRPLQDRQQAWQNSLVDLTARFNDQAVHAGLQAVSMQAALADIAAWENVLAPEMGDLPQIGMTVHDVARLSIELTYKEPTSFLSYTGLVVAGYGADEIFPSFKSITVYGHVGEELLVVDEAEHSVTHDNGAHIQAFARSSMIDMFTRGVDHTLWGIVNRQSAAKFAELVDALRATGLVIPANVAEPIVEAAQQSFRNAWLKENDARNLSPLQEVLDTLNVAEMAELAETLLQLESLKERVTSPSESVGGPVDVAVVTKSEGLVWIKRKHFFDPNLNLKFVNRASQH